MVNCAMFKRIFENLDAGLKAVFTRQEKYSDVEAAYGAIIANLGKKPDFIAAKSALEYAYDELSGEQLNHMMCYVSFAENDTKNKTEVPAIEFLSLCKAHPESSEISGFVLSSSLHAASVIRSNALVELILSFPMAKDIGLSSLEGASIYAMAENDPEIKRIESRGVDYDFGDGAPQILALFAAHKEKHHNNHAHQPKI